jgi:KDO2-lipid IV(A) lauroyltransferase
VLKDRLVSAAFSAGWSLVCRIPESWARALFNLGADIAWRRQGAGVQVLEGNLLRVLRTIPDEIPENGGREASPRGFGGRAAPHEQGGSGGDLPPGETADVDGKELRTWSRAVMRSYARYYMETFRLQVIARERILAGMHIERATVDLVLKRMQEGRGAIFALPHMGDFEQAGLWLNLIGAESFTTVAERLKPEAVFQKFLKFREALGMEVLATTGGPHPFGVMARRLRAGKLVCLVADRDLSNTGVEVDFFGEKALMPAGPAALALQTGAALHPVACWFVGDTEWGACVYDEVPVPAEGTRQEKIAVMTQEMTRRFEEGIREHPEDWHMLQKLFLADLDPARLARGRGEAPDDGEPEASPRGFGGRAAPHEQRGSGGDRPPVETL